MRPYSAKNPFLEIIVVHIRQKVNEIFRVYGEKQHDKNNG